MSRVLRLLVLALVLAGGGYAASRYFAPPPDLAGTEPAVVAYVAAASRDERALLHEIVVACTKVLDMRGAAAQAFVRACDLRIERWEERYHAGDAQRGPAADALSAHLARAHAAADAFAWHQRGSAQAGKGDRRTLDDTLAIIQAGLR